MMLSDSQLGAIRARHAAITPGLWAFWDHRGKQCTWIDGTPNGLPLGEDHQGVRIGGWNATMTVAADSQFIAHAPEDVAALLALVTAQAARLEKVDQHLRLVHHISCDYPFRTELPDDYAD